MLGFFSFILNRLQITIFSHLDVKILNIITCYIYKICFVFIVWIKADIYTVIINKTISV